MNCIDDIRLEQFLSLKKEIRGSERHATFGRWLLRCVIDFSQSSSCPHSQCFCNVSNMHSDIFYFITCWPSFCASRSYMATRSRALPPASSGWQALSLRTGQALPRVCPAFRNKSRVVSQGYRVGAFLRLASRARRPSILCPSQSQSILELRLCRWKKYPSEPSA